MGHHGGRPTAAATMLAAAAAALALLAGTARAAFVNAFGGVVHGAPLRLEWEAVDAGFYPLTLTARLINRTEGNRANGVVLNLTSAFPSSRTHAMGRIQKGSGVEKSIGNWRMLTSPSGSADQITTGSQWLWENVPWPLPHLHGALYEVQVRPSTGNPSVLARSGYFGIKDENPSQVSGPPPRP